MNFGKVTIAPERAGFKPQIQALAFTLVEWR
jgi:hypothetical protein